MCLRSRAPERLSIGRTLRQNGDVFVSELFAGKITRIPAGGGDPSTFVRVPAGKVVRDTR